MGISFDDVLNFPNEIGRQIGNSIFGITGLSKNVPQLEDEVTVEVVGQPGHNKQQLYYLALAAANGVVRKPGNLLSTVGSYGLLMIEYDAADNWVRCTMKYQFSMLDAATDYGNQSPNPLQYLSPTAALIGALSTDPPDPGDPKRLFNRLAVYRGPQCAVVGGSFDFTNTALPGVPGSTKSPGAPDLNYEGQTILTNCPSVREPNPRAMTQKPPASEPIILSGGTIPSPNPKPPGDNRSRGLVKVMSGSTAAGDTGFTPGKCCVDSTALIPLVFAALSSPATSSDMTYPLPTQGPKGS